MKDFLLTLDRQIQEALAIGEKFSLPEKNCKVSKIFLCGMGGSAIGGDILRVLAEGNARLPFVVSRSNTIPRWVDSNTLAIFSSYSGNTREVLTAFEKVRSAKPRILIVSSGGRLTEIARKEKWPHIQIPAGLPPRCAIGYLTFSLIPTLRKAGWLSLPEKEIRETINRIRHVSRKKAKSIAMEFRNKKVTLYGLPGLTEVAALRWRTQLAENAKTNVSSYSLPEMFHNEIEGWRFPRALMKQSVAVFLTDRDEPAWIRRKRMHAQKLIRNSGAHTMEIRSEGRSVLARIFSLISLGDWVSYELALQYGLDPLSIKSIEAIKKIN